MPREREIASSVIARSQRVRAKRGPDDRLHDEAIQTIVVESVARNDGASCLKIKSEGDSRGRAYVCGPDSEISRSARNTLL
jgi:hypothetical protein